MQTWIGAGCLCLAQAATGALTWIDVPWVKQEADGCGAAAIVMVVGYWQAQQAVPSKALDADAVFVKLSDGPGRGIRASVLSAYLREQGFKTFAMTGTKEDFALQLAKGRPLIVALGNGAGNPLHYVVVVGAGPEVILVNDPARGKLRKMPLNEFAQRWEEAERWMLLAVPREQQ